MRAPRIALSLAAAVAAVAGMFLLAACKERPMTAREIYRHDASGVALVSNHYYYAMSLAGFVVYFSGIDTAGNFIGLTESRAAAARKPAVRYGAGFLVSREGNLITNRHVVRPEIPDSVAIAAAVRWRIQTIVRLSDMRGAAKSPEEAEQCDARLATLEAADPADVMISASCQIAATFAKQKDGKPAQCRIVQVAGIDDVDLAVVRLADRKTYKGRYVFHFATGTKGKRTLLETYLRRARRDYKGRRLRPGTPLCMIAFDGKSASAVQVAEGSVAEGKTAEHLLFSIAAPAVADGSPILNMYGDVVGVCSESSRSSRAPGRAVPSKYAKIFLGLDDY